MPLRYVIELARLRTFVGRHPFGFAVVLALGVVAWRGFLMLGPSQGGGAGMPLHFVILAVTPFIFLNRKDRQAIGLSAAAPVAWIAAALLTGGVAGVAFGFLGTALYGASELNWYVSVRDTMLADPRLRALSGVSLFAAVAGPAAIFSPIGEELFFRGVLTELAARTIGARPATAFTAAVFGGMHVLHHGIDANADGFRVHTMSAAIWIVLTIALSYLFAWLRRRSHSLWAAVASHAAFNIAMVAFIVWMLR